MEILIQSDAVQKVLDNISDRTGQINIKLEEKYYV